FWVLLPKQKGLACRGETRQPKKITETRVGDIGVMFSTNRRLFTGKAQDGFLIHIIETAGAEQNGKR
ncbi:hypothetical protein, partial [uncultured Nitrospira sp.]|uniref:hypothetical protein n=1 Tax=uncultured Nitrospira sp. TaxID=157176 RepID=UPI0031409C4F